MPGAPLDGVSEPPAEKKKFWSKLNVFKRHKTPAESEAR